MAAAVLLRSVARKMSRTAAPITHYHHSLVARGLHGGAPSGPANSNQIKQGAANVLVSAGMAAATGLRSGPGWLTTKLAQAQPPSTYHRLFHGRRIHSRTNPDPIPSATKKVLDTITFDKAAAGTAYIVLVSATIYMHFWVKPKVDKITAQYEDLLELAGRSNKLGPKESKDLEATIMSLKAEIAELKIALDSARSQGKQ